MTFYIHYILGKIKKLGTEKQNKMLLNTAEKRLDLRKFSSYFSIIFTKNNTTQDLRYELKIMNTLVYCHISLVCTILFQSI